MSNSRIREITPGVMVERVAADIHISYNTLTQGANITFQGEEFLLDAAAKPVAALAGREALHTSLGAIAGRTFDVGIDPVTGADLSRISVAGIGNLIRAVYDQLHNARAAGTMEG